MSQEEHVLSIPGLDGYRIRNCCRKGPGTRCRCGSLTGWKSNCFQPCTIGLQELVDSEPILFPTQIRLVGRLIHVETNAPLQDEAVSITLPGGQTVSSSSTGDGTFVLAFGDPGTGATHEAALGDLVSVSRSEREVDEDPTYRFFLMK